MKILKAENLNREAFQEYGDIIDTSQQAPVKINGGRCLRYNNLANLSFKDGNPGISLFDSKKVELPYRFSFMEKHPLGSQAFIPVFGSSFIVIVARDFNGKPGKPKAFTTKSGQGVNYHRNTWHGILAPLDEPGLFTVVDWLGSGDNLITYNYAKWYSIEAT